MEGRVLPINAFNMFYNVCVDISLWLDPCLAFENSFLRMECKSFTYQKIVSIKFDFRWVK